MGSIGRLLIGLPGAALVTAVLFLIMGALIKSPNEVQLSEDKSVNIKITRQIQDNTQNQAKTQLERPVLDQPPPPPPAVNDATFRPKVSGQIGDIPDFSQTNLNIGTGFNPDRDAQPLVRIPPQYPENCMSRAKEEENVLVEFDVTPEGVVVNPRVLDASNSCLNRAAMRAVQRWKYQPKIVDGEAKPRYGVQTNIVFRLAPEN